jgi:hypothetical protein
MTEFKKSPVMEMIEDACKIEALLDGLTCSDGKGGRVHYRDLHPRPEWWQRILDKKKQCKEE